MRNQAEGVCIFLTPEYIQNHGGARKILNYALLSHALDGRHLLAVLSAQDFDQCFQDPSARQLMLYRLQQAGFIIAGKSEQLGIDFEEMSQLLS